MYIENPNIHVNIYFCKNSRFYGNFLSIITTTKNEYILSKTSVDPNSVFRHCYFFSIILKNNWGFWTSGPISCLYE